MLEWDEFRTDLVCVYSCTNDKRERFLHCHAEYEIYYFLQGDVDYQVDGRHYRMKPESILLIPPDCLHGFINKSSQPYQRFAIHFSPKILDESERSLLLQDFTTPDKCYPKLAKDQTDMLTQSVMECRFLEEPLQKIALKTRIAALLLYIHQTLVPDKLNLLPGTDERIRNIVRYINNNLTEEIFLDDLVKKFNISKSHIGVLFRREMGTTVNRYLCLKRLIVARQKIQTGSSAQEAAYKAGFNDYSNFFRAYKSLFGAAPTFRDDSMPQGII
jgi:AraC-like DNA-binding protein